MHVERHQLQIDKDSAYSLSWITDRCFYLYPARNYRWRTRNTSVTSGVASADTMIDKDGHSDGRSTARWRGSPDVWYRSCKSGDSDYGGIVWWCWPLCIPLWIPPACKLFESRTTEVLELSCAERTIREVQKHHKFAAGRAWIPAEPLKPSSSAVSPLCFSCWVLTYGHRI